MRPTAVAVAAALLAGGLLALWGLARKHEIGSFARSPQLIEVPVGKARVAAGGRALVRTAAVAADAAELIVSCREESAALELKIGDRAEEAICGVTVTYLAMLGTESDEDDPLRAVVEAAWP